MGGAGGGGHGGGDCRASHQSSEHGQQGEQIAARLTRETGRLTRPSAASNWMPDAGENGQTSGLPLFFGPKTWWWKDARRSGPDRSEADGVCVLPWPFSADRVHPGGGRPGFEAAAGLLAEQVDQQDGPLSPSGSR